MESKIQPIDSHSVHRICSGQVILDLANVIKELVENALDAQSTEIEISLKQKGREIVQVRDNGSGISESNFELLLLHFKDSFNDFLSGISSYGFRGEALSSLCALSELKFVTKTKEQEIGYEIDYDFEGNLKNVQKTSRLQGTTVQVRNLFLNLPVRFQDFCKNEKKEFQKAQTLLHGYGIISTGVKFTCIDLDRSFSKNVGILFETHGKSIRDNVSDIYGEKFCKNLIDFSFKSVDFQMDGLISNKSNGRSTGDRQFLFLNKRPIDFPKLNRIINEVFKTFNKKEYPVFMIHLQLPPTLFDINVTPNKRKVLIHNDSSVLESIKEYFISFWNGTVIPEKSMKTSHFFSNKPQEKSKSSQVSGLLGKLLHKTSFSQEEPILKKSKMECIDLISDDEWDLKEIIQSQEKQIIESQTIEEKQSQIIESQIIKEKQSQIIESQIIKEKQSQELFDQSYEITFFEPSNTISKDEITFFEPSNTISKDEIEISSPTLSFLSSQNELSQEPSKDLENSETLKTDKEFEKILQMKDVICEMNFDSIEQLFRESLSIPVESSSNKPYFVTNLSTSNKESELEFNRIFKKEYFSRMRVVGQFNKGFILALLNSDLFIIDQHASDEKFNYETLRKTSVLSSQPLVHPEPLNLASDEELIVIDNLKIFQTNGFEFKIDLDAPPTKRIFLTAKPISKNLSFGSFDVFELISLLRDTPGQMCRLSRVNSMFASRACRKSIMVGTSLSKSEMQKVISHMGELEMPWNCPHGRPTMRHLLDINLFQNKLK